MKLHIQLYMYIHVHVLAFLVVRVTSFCEHGTDMVHVQERRNVLEIIPSN